MATTSWSPDVAGPRPGNLTGLIAYIDDLVTRLASLASLADTLADRLSGVEPTPPSVAPTGSGLQVVQQSSIISSTERIVTDFSSALVRLDAQLKRIEASL